MIPSSKRRCVSPFTWNRFKVIDAPFRELGVVERPNTELMKMMVDMYPDDEDVRRNGDQLMEKRGHLIRGNGEQRQVYDQKDMATFAPSSYHGTTKIGRAYTQSLLPRLPSKLLNTIYKDTHVNLDIRSSFSTMLSCAFADCTTSTMDSFLENPRYIYDHLDHHFMMDKRAAKKFISSMICAYPGEPSCDNWVDLSRDSIVSGLRKDVGTWATALRARYPEYYEMVRARCESDGKIGRVDGVALSFLAQDMEHSVMRSVIDFLYPGSTNVVDVVWKYDGLIFHRGVLGAKSTEAFVREVKAHVRDRMLLDVDFSLSYLHENSLGICLPNAERAGGLSDYLRWKAVFEKTFCRLALPPVFVMFGDDGKTFFDITSNEKFNHVTMEEDKEMIKRWLADPHKRKYRSRDFLPPPLPVPDECLNLYYGIAAASLPPVMGHVSIEPYLRHVDLLCGNWDGDHPDYANYLHNLIAQKMQTPGSKWGVMPIIMSAQGVGKDIWFDFLARVFGQYQCIKDDGIHKFSGMNSHCLEGKLLCCLQEMGYKDTRQHEEALKALITNETIKVEKKYVNSFVVTNVVDFIGFTNQFGAINVSPDDRRYFVLTADSRFMQDAAYILPLLAFFREPSNQRAVYDWYMARDITGFNSSGDRPITESMRDMVTDSLPHIDRFLETSLPLWQDMCHQQDQRLPKSKWDYAMVENDTLRVSSRVVVDDWMAFLEAAGVERADKRLPMVQFLSRQVRELNGRSDKDKTNGHKKLIDTFKSHGTRTYVFNVVGVKNYLERTLGKDEDGDGEDTAHPQPTATRKLFRNSPGQTPLFVIKERGEVVFGTDDLEEANKELGEAYVVTLPDEQGKFLVHPARNNMVINLGTEYMGQHAYQRIEGKYPFYRRDRTA